MISLSMPPSVLLSPVTPSPNSSSWHTARTGLSPTPQQPCTPTEIVPRLYISDLASAESAASLRAHGITHVLSAMCGRVILPPDVPIKQLQLPLQDSPFAELAEFLPTSTAFVANALRDPNARVLVHCVQGVSRSSSVVCAYLIAEYGWTPDRALQFLLSKYSQAEPNPGFIMQLNEYARSLQGSVQ
ncbi:phosphatases II [Laetiporus sulphureus 93-53]|uniref:protein-tyrosine-phosphatase n=1 Tax=Laetiporus sulphureus 93-53 TaxID=1314785 RepID=A0A165G133_9APHY|nr:phosphatases II [Laetiporus sulphureus 93-53]KZT09688.1 phosphatases II [Laetiporus sulphureus 93-53]